MGYMMNDYIQISIVILILTSVAAFAFGCVFWRRKRKSDQRKIANWLKLDNIATATATVIEIAEPMYNVFEGWNEQN